VRTIDLNADLGEDPDAVRDGRDEALLAVVSSVNVACGGHAGDEATMESTVLAALRHGVALGAHPSFPDRARFGRAHLSLTPDEIAHVVYAQVADLGQVAARWDAPLVHLKPHGALYGACDARAEVAEAVGTGAGRWCRSLRLVGRAGSPALAAWRGMGFAVLGEAFADRRYEADGTLRSRSLPDALILDPEEAADQALSIVLDGGVTAADGSRLEVKADSLCVHGDTPGAAVIARAVRERLEKAGVAIRRP
jgi:UPF0271 protein